MFGVLVTLFVIFAMIALSLLMVMIRKYDLVIWPVWAASVGYCMVLIRENEQPLNSEMGMHPGQAVGLVILATVLYLLFAGAIGRILRKLFRHNKLWQNWALGLSILLLLLPLIAVVYLEITA